MSLKDYKEYSLDMNIICMSDEQADEVKEALIKQFSEDPKYKGKNIIVNTSKDFRENLENRGIFKSPLIPEKLSEGINVYIWTPKYMPALDILKLELPDSFYQY